jgi:peptidoglycan DL-endopeptidase CwlO
MQKKILLAVVVVGLVVYAIGHRASPTEKQITERTWAVEDSKAYAQDVILAWANNQYECLDKLWTQESNWRAEAYNKVKVMGKNAGGIPQILGLDPTIPATLQIDRGFAYIMHRYGTPCMAWKFHERKGWY